jgi:hypothetical protein
MIDQTIQTTDRCVGKDLDWDGLGPDGTTGKVNAIFLVLTPEGEKVDYGKPQKELVVTAVMNQDTFIALRATVYKDEEIGRPPILSIDHIGRRLVGWRNTDTGESWTVKIRTT